MTTPCSLGLPNLNSPSSPPSFLVLFLLPLWLICVSFNLVPRADSFFFCDSAQTDVWITGNLIRLAARPFMFFFPSPCRPLWVFLDSFFGLRVHCLSFWYIHIHRHSGI
ncbi:hypothetical protein V8C34DRAFT_142692 [Trichoderma compactum]